MLTFTSLGTSLSNGTDTWALEFQYANICTNFNHSNGATTFDGNARINGGTAYRISSGSTVSLGTAPALTLAVSTATFNTLTSAGSCLLFVINVPNPYGTAFSVGSTTVGDLAASLNAFFQLSDSTSVFGNISGALGNFSGPISFGGSAVDMTRGGSCPV